MAKPADYWQSADLKAIEENGLIREDVMEKIWDISKIPLPFTDIVGTDTCTNSYTEWTTDKLDEPQLGGWVVDGADSDQNDAKGGKRLGNHCGILTKEVQVSARARASDTIGRGDELSYQVMMRQRELRRNVEANALGIQGSQSDDGDTQPGIPAGLAAMMTPFDTGSGYDQPGFSGGGWGDVTPGAAPVGLTEMMVRDAAQEAWEGGADPGYLMSVPGLIRKLSEYMFTSSSRIATLTRDTRGITGGAEALGTVNTFITDFGVTMDFIPNRIQRAYDVAGTGDGCAAFLFDPAYFRLSFLRGYRVEDLAKTGLSDKRLMSVDWTLKALNPDAGRVLLDLDYAADVVLG
ncbi:DUF5309 family protein [Paracoccus sp. MBLB3053]|uniref:DUF5309 family protein n=1 Tax=Paracoccus aurantius TaxID=3073814 RepID=A0ABU2I155_9RHOB|nr:DUF5309 family protein [Paracoccus sp. MBLB3053]MDS9470284.1 DUF5309 family protein [Paracoccus sp. MBLB3053]